MKFSFLIRTALAALLAVLSFTACKKSNDASAPAQKESKITGSPSDPAISLKPTWPTGKRYVMRMESDQSSEMPNMQAARDGQPQKAPPRRFTRGRGIRDVTLWLPRPFWKRGFQMPYQSIDVDIKIWIGPD